jgi:group II intron reverse transcriptase/maturase
MKKTRRNHSAAFKAKVAAKRERWEAYKRVKANQGAAGVDGQSITEFEEDLKDNLYQLWNRMSSGSPFGSAQDSYFPPPVRRVEIPKGEGQSGTRPLGIPTVSDRIAQMVVQRYLEPILEPVFHDDPYGYRPGRSAHDALRVARSRCWRYDWVVGPRHQEFFRGNRLGTLGSRAVRHHTECTCPERSRRAWVLRYLERWLKAPVCLPDGALVERERGTPQGAVASPILADLFLP